MKKRQIRSGRSVSVASTDLSQSGQSKDSKKTTGVSGGSSVGSGIDSQLSDSTGVGQFQEVELDGKKYWLPNSNYTSTSALSMVSSVSSFASSAESTVEEEDDNL